MPRPYGWIRGEGTTKNQRWGLGSLMDSPVIPKLGFSGMGDIVGSAVDWTNPDYGQPTYVNYTGADATKFSNVDSYFQQQVDANNMAVWIKQNGTLLLVGGIVGLLLFKR